MNPHVVIAAMPYINTSHAPMAAPAVLKASLSQHGISCAAMDLNIEVLVKVKNHPLCDKIEDFFSTETIHDDAIEYVSQILFYCAKRILDEKPTIIGLSLLAFECQLFTAWLCTILRQLAPECKIVIGGPGIKFHVSDINDTYRNKMREMGLVDDFISGDGDVSLVEYIKGNTTYPGINTDNWNPVELESLPLPDYSDYNFFWYTTPFMPVVDSKGCVRNCEFCDVIEYWSKFQSRKADHIFSEMLSQIEKYNIRNFDFRSSITNGNLKEFKKLLALMNEYNKGKFRSEQLSWNASFIIRQASQHPESMWEQIGATHGTLSLGVESIIPEVRHGMGKHFNNEDIDYHLEMARKYNVKVVLLIITGYPTETLEDYETTKTWLRERSHYANNPIQQLFLSKCAILPGTQLARNSRALGLTNTEHIMQWHNPSKNISAETRAKHHNELVAMCKHLGFSVSGH